MMNAEAGLYFKFDIDEGGIPKSCPGLENFKTEVWKSKGGRRKAFFMDCPLNDRSLPADDKPISDIITDYANDQVRSIEYRASFHLNFIRICGSKTLAQRSKEWQEMDILH